MNASNIDAVRKQLEVLQSTSPLPWAHDGSSQLDFGYRDAKGAWTILAGERREGAVDKDDPEGIAIVAILNAVPLLLDELKLYHAYYGTGLAEELAVKYFQTLP